MDFIDFEAEIDNINDDEKEEFISSDDDDSFIDDASNIFESICEHYTCQNDEVKIKDVLKNAHEKAMSDLDKASEFINFPNADLVEVLPEITTFCGSEKRISHVEKSLVALHGVGSIDSFFMQSAMQLVMKKQKK